MGGQKEAQFNIAFEDLPDIGTVFRYGIAFSFQRNEFLSDPVAVLGPKVGLFNDWLAWNEQSVSDLRMWCVTPDGHFGPHPVSSIPAVWMHWDNFIFIGNYWRKTADEITDSDIKEIMRVFDILMPVYRYIEDNTRSGLDGDESHAVRHSKSGYRVGIGVKSIDNRYC